MYISFGVIGKSCNLKISDFMFGNLLILIMYVLNDLAVKLIRILGKLFPANRNIILLSLFAFLSQISFVILLLAYHYVLVAHLK